MRTLARPSLIVFFTVIGTALLSVITTISTVVTLTATALIVPGTGTPNANIVADYLKNADDYYIAPFNPACTSANDCSLQGIDYPAQFWPIPLPGWGGLSGKKWNVSTGEGIANLNTALQPLLGSATPDDPVIIMGYSQGGNVVSRYKKTLAGQLTEAQKQALAFVMIGNTNRPNGGLFERLAYLGTVPILDASFGLPAPTNSGIKTTDIAFQYDGVADFPLYPLNALADLNAIFGFWYVHGSYLAPNARDTENLPDNYTPEELQAAITNPNNQQTYGDTTYVTIPTRTLPLVQPLLDIGRTTHTMAIMQPIVDLISPVLRVLIDTGYDRSLNPGIPAPFRLIPLLNPITLAVNIVNAIADGVQAAINDITGRPNSTPTPAPVATPPTTSEAPVAALRPTAALHPTAPTAALHPTAPPRTQRQPLAATDQQQSSADQGATPLRHTRAQDAGKRPVAKPSRPSRNHQRAA